MTLLQNINTECGISFHVQSAYSAWTVFITQTKLMLFSLVPDKQSHGIRYRIFSRLRQIPLYLTEWCSSPNNYRITPKYGGEMTGTDGKIFNRKRKARRIFTLQQKLPFFFLL